jgi:glycosyltransferase involved in cell wall biosynthesis
VGDGPLLESARTLATELDVAHRVDFVGYRSNAISFIAHSRLLVIPSRWEGFGLVAVEAAALGVPVVGTAVNGLTELIPAYVPGRLVAPDDPAGLADAMRQALEQHSNGPRPSLARFSPEDVARSYAFAAGLG